MRLHLIYLKGFKKSLLESKMVFSWFSSSSDSTDPTPETERSGYECAPYTILESNQDYEVRRYPERKWATVVYEKMGTMGHNDMPLSSNYNDQPQNGSFMKLFRYISGANEPGSKISMTVPVATKVTMDSNDQGPVIREEMGFYVPTEHQDTTPAPASGSDVNIVTRPDMVAYVRKFGGYAKDADWSSQREQLIADLKNRKDADTIDFDSFYRLGYDAPYKFWGRKNEVFVIKKSD